MNKFTLTGELIVKNDKVQVTEKFSKREFVIKTDGEHPQEVQFQLAQDKCALLDSYNIGDKIDVNFNIRGREWTSPQGEVRYFNTLDAWKLDLVMKAGSDGLPTSPNANSLSPINSLPDDSQLPF
ncbi:MAG TPA: DUF3127 domain-containing protein [Cyclobacteriaceae bacterium]